MNSNPSFRRLLLCLACFATFPMVAPAETLFGLDQANRIFTFDSVTPSATTFLNGGLAISGLPAGEILLGIDIRAVATNSPNAASNGALYALGLSNRLYTVNTSSGTATQVGTTGAFTLTGNSFGVDFNPVPDRLRVISEQDQNLRLNPNDGALAGTDTPLAYASGDSGFGLNPNVVGAAYSNNFGGATQSTLYGIDSARDVVVRIGGVNGTPSPNGGQLTTIGSLGVNTIDEVGFDISGISGSAFASLSTRVGPLDTSSDLYAINLSSGESTLIGSIGPAGGLGAFITRDIAAGVGTPVPEPTTSALLALAFSGLVWRRRALIRTPQRTRASIPTGRKTNPSRRIHAFSNSGFQACAHFNHPARLGLPPLRRARLQDTSKALRLQSHRAEASSAA